MCFDISNNFKEVLKAENDVVCYKVVYSSPNYKKNEFVSYWRSKEYVTGQTYKLSGTFRKHVGDRRIRKGFHSYKLLLEANKRKYYNTVVIECIIPAGSLYWENEKEYCSNSLKIVQQITGAHE